MVELKDLVDFLFISAGPLLLLVDIGLDIYTAVSLYQEKECVYFGILLLFLVGSSVLAQIFSWLLYSYDEFDSCLSKTKLKALHVFQLGSFLRWYESLSDATDSFTSFNPKSIEQYLNKNLGVLRLIETFSESAPQLVLMLTIILRRGRLDTETAMKALGSASLIAVSVTMYHRSMRSFLQNKEKHPLCSLAVYFLWNFLLISSRLTALALFTSVLTYHIFIHFGCSWIILLFLFLALRSKSEFMDSPCGEWLYWATVGLIWYFNWLNMVGGNTKCLTLVYHVYILVDIVLLCSLWYWKRSTEIPQLYAIITVVCVVSVYILGLLFRKVYYNCCHPDLGKDGLTGQETENGKMKKLAENFYFSSPAPPDSQG